MNENDFRKEDLYDRYVENPEELDKMLRRILTSEAIYYVFKELPNKVLEIDLFEYKFGIALYYINRGYPKPDAPKWNECTIMNVTGFERITKQGVLKIIGYIKKLKRLKKMKATARRVDDGLFFTAFSI